MALKQRQGVELMFVNDFRTMTVAAHIRVPGIPDQLAGMSLMRKTWNGTKYSMGLQWTTKQRFMALGAQKLEHC